jgi:hypothetical protein
MTYKDATDYAKKMAMTEQELMSNMQSPCVNVDVGNVDEALANARRFDQMVCRSRANIRRIHWSCVR